MTPIQWLRASWTWLRWRIIDPLVARNPLSRKGSEPPVAPLLPEEDTP
jgi:hypothetical protein